MFGKKKIEADVLVVGAGPVGLFTALALSERGVDVAIADKDWRGSVKSYALALHPHSLRLLDGLGLARKLVEQGHRVERVAFYDGDSRVAALDYSSLEGNFPFLLVVPQSELEDLLEAELAARKIQVLWKHQAMALDAEREGVTLKLARMEKYSMGYPIARTEWMVEKELGARARFVVGADGYHSMIRRALGLRYEDLEHSETFAVFEFPGRMEFLHEARVVFSGDTTNVVWPLSEGRGRWSFQVGDPPPAGAGKELLQELLHQRVPWFRPVIDEVSWTTTALFERRLAERFGRERTWLVGDAAHITGPVGVQSMNVGLREAHDLADDLSAALSGGGSMKVLETWGQRYREEWRRLLGVSGRLEADVGAPDWVRRNPQRLLPCIPASGADLQHLLAQVGLRLNEA